MCEIFISYIFIFSLYLLLALTFVYFFILFFILFFSNRGAKYIDGEWVFS